MMLVITTDGGIEAVYADQLARRSIGKMEVTRASNVEFEPERQEWVASFLDGTSISHKEREKAIELEKAIVEQQLIERLAN